MSQDISILWFSAAAFVLPILYLCIKIRRLSALTQALELDRKRNHDAFLEQIQLIKLHLKRHEELLGTIERDRLSPMQSNILTLHSDQKEILVYVSKLFSDLNFGTNFTKKGNRA